MFATETDPVRHAQNIRLAALQMVIELVDRMDALSIKRTDILEDAARFERYLRDGVIARDGDVPRVMYHPV